MKTRVVVNEIGRDEYTVTSRKEKVLVTGRETLLKFVKANNMRVTAFYSVFVYADTLFFN